MSGAGPRGASLSERAAEKLVSEATILLHGAARAVRLYPAENAAVRKVVTELGHVCDRIEATDRQFALKRAGDYLFINDTRLRLGFDNFAAVNAVLALLRDAAVGTIQFRARPTHRDWVVLLGAMALPPPGSPNPSGWPRWWRAWTRRASRRSPWAPPMRGWRSWRGRWTGRSAPGRRT